MAEYITKEQVIEWFRPYGHTGEGIPYCGLVTDIREMPAASVVPRWISVEDKLPANEMEVLVVCVRNGFRFVCPAIHEDGTVLTQNSSWNWYELDNYGTYSEENDDYFVPEGWWENRKFTPDGIYNNPVDCAVTHWAPLPELPDGENGGEGNSAD